MKKTLLGMRKTALVLAAILSVSLALVSWLGNNIADPAWLALGLAIAAVCMAIYGALKAGLLEFSPEVLAGDVIVPRPSRAGGDVKLLLPLQFTNGGTADGVVEWVAVRLTMDGDIQRSVLLSPVAEVDMQRFIQAKRKLDDQNAVEPFTAFALEGKRSLAKFVLFDVAEKGRSEPLRLRPGRWSFELFLKSTANRSPKLERCFEHVVEKKHTEQFAEDSPVYLINYQITLPSARRELAGAEWMPRQARYSN
ncbi:MAG: hypothetical protein ABR570_18165 [Burkholderiales bacterium]